MNYIQFRTISIVFLQRKNEYSMKTVEKKRTIVGKQIGRGQGGNDAELPEYIQRNPTLRKIIFFIFAVQLNLFQFIKEKLLTVLQLKMG